MKKDSWSCRLISRREGGGSGLAGEIERKTEIISCEIMRRKEEEEEREERAREKGGKELPRSRT